MDSRSSASLTIPGAIIIAAAIIAIAIIYVLHPARNASSAAPAANTTVSMQPVTSTDHILGNPNAQIKIVEFSDPSCPYCKIFNPTMVQIMDAYGSGGKVAWVYRDFPLDRPDQNGNILHPNAGQEAEAMECVAALGGNDKFWAYEKEWYTVFPQDGADRPADEDLKQIQDVAAHAGVDAVAFNECLSSGRTKDKVQSQFLDGINSGVSGTPYSIILTPSGSKIPLVGAQSYASVKAAIEALLPTAK